LLGVAFYLALSLLLAYMVSWLVIVGTESDPEVSE
jgi:hypothetical protein